MTSIGNNATVWQWIAASLMAILLSGGSYALGGADVEDRLLAVELQQTVLAERQARDASDIRLRLERIEDATQQIALYIYGVSVKP